MQNHILLVELKGFQNTEVFWETVALRCIYVHLYFAVDTRSVEIPLFKQLIMSLICYS